MDQVCERLTCELCRCFRKLKTCWDKLARAEKNTNSFTRVWRTLSLNLGQDDQI